MKPFITFILWETLSVKHREDNEHDFYSNLNTPTITSIILPKLQTNNKVAPCNPPRHQQLTQSSFQGATSLSLSGPSQCHVQLSFGRILNY